MIRKKRTEYAPAKKFEIGSLESRAAARHMLAQLRKTYVLLVCRRENEGTGLRPDLRTAATLLSRYQFAGDEFLTIALEDGDPETLSNDELISWADATAAATTSKWEG